MLIFPLNRTSIGFSNLTKSTTNLIINAFLRKSNVFADV